MEVSVFCNVENLLFLPFCIYYVASMPQILTNYRNKSAEGLSYRMVFFDYTGAIFTTIYTFLLCLPLQCKIMEPLCAMNIAVLAYQGYYYSKHTEIRRNIIFTYLALHAVCLGMIVASRWYCHEVGHFIGWASVCVQFFTQLPQVLKNHRRRSVQGLSFLYMSMLGLAGCMEMAFGYAFKLPMQNIFNGLRGVCYYMVLCYQFYIYRHTMKKWW